MQLGVAPADVLRMQQLIAEVKAELCYGESEESAAKRALETAESKPARLEVGVAEEKANAANAGATEEKATALSRISREAEADDPPVATASSPVAAASPSDDVASVRDFLEPLGLAEFAARFEQEDIDMPTLRELSEGICSCF